MKSFTRNQKPPRTTLWRTQVVLSFLFLLIGGVTLIWWLTHISEQDEKSYLEMMERSRKSGGQPWPEEGFTSHQYRSGVQKDLYFWKEEKLHHLQCFSSQSEIVFEKSEEILSLKEVIGKTHCAFQEELYFQEGKPRQKVQLLVAKKGVVDLDKKVFRMEEVTGALVDAPGHFLPVTKEMGDVLMEGEAKIIEINFREKPIIQAEKFQGKFFSLDLKGFPFPLQGQGRIEKLVYELASGNLQSSGRVNLGIIDKKRVQQYRFYGYGNCFLDQNRGEFSADSPIGTQDQQLRLSTEWGTLKGDDLQILFEKKEGQHVLSSCFLTGHVSIRNRFSELSQTEGILDQYILADSLRFFPESRQWIISANPSRRVLFYDAVHGMEVSAPEAGIHFGDAGLPEIQGFGDVRFSFQQKELNRLKKRFPNNSQ